MYEYKFVEADMGGFFKDPTYKYEIIKQAKDGWRFVTALTSEQSMEGRIKGYTLVFERKTDL